MRPIGVHAFQIEHLSVVDESVHDGMGYRIVSKNLIELPERQIGCGYCPQLLIMSARYDLEEQIGAWRVQAYVAEFVND